MSAIKLPKIQPTDDFQCYIEKVNAVIDSVNKGDLSKFIGDRELIYFDTVSNMVEKEDLVVGDVCMVLEEGIAKMYKIVSSALEFDMSLHTYYRLANGWWAYEFMKFSGGGSGTPSEPIHVETSHPTTFAIALGDNVEIPYTYQTSSGTAGVLKIYLNGVLKMTSNINNGASSVNISNLLTSPGTQTVEMSFVDRIGSAQTLTFVVEVVSLSISSNFDDTVAYTGSTIFSYTPRGTVSKTIHFMIDGVEAYSDIVNVSGKQQSRTIHALSHGTHTLEVYASALINGVTVKSNVLRYALITYEENNETPIIASRFQETQVVQGTLISIDYRVFTPNANESYVTLLKDGKTLNNITVGKSTQYWNFSENIVGDYLYSIKVGEITKNFPVKVTQSTVEIEAETEGLTLHLTSFGRSNSELSKESWVSGDVSCSLTDFNYNTNGWVITEDGEIALRVNGIAKVTIPHQMFSLGLNPKTNGSTIEFEFKTRNVSNYEATLISCLNNAVGIKITPQKAILSSQKLSGDSAVSVQYKEGERVRVAFVIESPRENRLIKIYLNGVLSALAQYDSDDLFIQGTPVDVTIGSSEAGIDIFQIRKYSYALTSEQVLNNYIADMQRIDNKTSAYTRNDIYDDYNNISYTEVSKRMPCLVITGTLPASKGDKQTVQCTYKHHSDSTKNFEHSGVSIDVQGTSSQFYPRKNYKVELPQAYQLRDNSIPVKEFTFKADFMDSSHRHNTVNADLVNDMYKAVGLLPPQEDNKDVRMSIDGYICAIFHRETEDDDLTFLGSFNFNLDKGSNDAFGYNPTFSECESWELCNNTSKRCLFKEFWSPYYRLVDGTYVLVSLYNPSTHVLETDTQYYKLKTESTEPDEFITVAEYYTSPTSHVIDIATDFEARYPEKYYDYTALSRVIEWVASTENNLNKFMSEIDQYFSKPHLLAYFVIATSLGMVDSLAKNMFLSTWDGLKWYPIFYDIDTCFGLNNEGEPKFGYDIEFKDVDTFNGVSSVLWSNIQNAYSVEISAMYSTLVGAGFTYENITQRNINHVKQIAEAMFNEEAAYRYVDPLVNDGNGTYLYMAQGTRLEHFKWWISNRFNYLNSKYFTSDYKTDFLTIRMYTPRDENGEVATGLVVQPNYDFNIQTSASEYVSIMFGSAINGARVRKGDTVKIAAPINTIFSDTETIVYGASRISSLGDLSAKYPSTVDISGAYSLKELVIGNSNTKYTNPYLKNLHFGNNVLLSKLDVRNCTELTGTLDLSSCENIESVQATGTKITGVTLPSGGHLKTLQLPSTVTNLTIRNQHSLSTLNMAGYTNLTTLRIENIPSTISLSTIVNGATNLAFVRLIGVNLSIAGFTVLDRLARLGGLDEEGNPTNTPIITGTYYSTTKISTSELNTAKAKYASIFPDLTIESALLDPSTVKFYGYDGTLLDEQLVGYGESASDPINRVSNPISTPTRPADSACSSYTFSGWTSGNLNNPLANVTNDRIVFATYDSVPRVLTVNFYNGTELINTSSTNYGKALSVGEPQTYPGSEEGNWKFWKWDKDVNYITSSFDTHAVWVDVDELNGFTSSSGRQIPYKTPLSELSWTEIKEIAYAGLSKFWWSLGNEKTIVLSDGESITLQIVGFDHDRVSESGLETLPITFQMKNLMSSTYSMNATPTNSGGYKNSDMRTYLNQTIYSKLPEDLKSLITPTCKSQPVGSMSTVSETVTDKLWLASSLELNATLVRDRKIYEGRAYPIYQNAISRVKYLKNGTGASSSWYTRTPSTDSPTSFRYISSTGERYDIGASNKHGVSFGFCI